MIPGFERIVEERIKAAQANGDFDHLDGSGKPLETANDAHINEELRTAYKILKNADYIPEEVELRNEIEKTEDLLANIEDSAERYKTIKKLNFMIMKVNSSRNSSVMFEIPQKYELRLVERLDKKEIE